MDGFGSSRDIVEALCFIMKLKVFDGVRGLVLWVLSWPEGQAWRYLCTPLHSSSLPYWNDSSSVNFGLWRRVTSITQSSSGGLGSRQTSTPELT